MKQIIILSIFIIKMATANAQCNISLVAIDSALCFGGSTPINVFNNNTSMLLAPSAYCNCSAANSNNADIINFKLGSINNSTNCITPLIGSQGLGVGTASSYANFNASIAPQSISAGATYSFSAGIASCANQVSNTFYLYIDYNRDGDFSDSLELAYMQANVFTPSTIVNNFTVPQAVVNGQTRLRIIIQEGAPIIIDGCGAYTGGETEDYLVNLQSDTTIYTWNPSVGLNTTGGTNVVATPSATTTYTVTAANSSGCITSSTITIAIANAALNTTAATITNVSCFGASTGIATTNPIGGTMPYTYNWLPLGINTATITGLVAGVYYVDIMDAFGCKTSDSVTILQNSQINPTVISTNSLCFAPATGSINITTTGGVTPYTFSWNPNVSNTNTANNLGAGTYIITITDANNCTKQVTKNVQSPALLSSTIAVQTGMATAFVGGGVPPYTYTWNPGNLNTQTINAAGEFTCTVTDANGCIDSKEINIPAPLSTSNFNLSKIKIASNANYLTVSGNNIYKIEIINSLGQTISKSYNKHNYQQFLLVANTQILVVKVTLDSGEIITQKVLVN